MRERSAARTEQSYTAYFGGMTEVELQYNDYFETEMDGEQPESFHEAVDDELVRSKPEYKASRYNFVENSIDGFSAIEDATSHVEKLIFKFRNRRGIDSVSDYERRQSRMVSR